MLLGGTTDDISVWRDIAKRFEVKVFAGLFLNDFNEGLPISSATVSALGARNIALDLDIYGGPYVEENC